MAAGRPTKYKAEYTGPARKLALCGWADEEIAWFFDVDLGTLACWAWDNEEFFNAITPSAGDKAVWEAEKAARREKVNAAKRRRRASNPSERLVNAMRARLWAALKGRTDGALFGRLGYSCDDLTRHLEARFQPGMTWENYGLWHVDHVLPCASFDQADPDQFTKCWSLGNLQPLWAGDNIKKGAQCLP